ncbi:hypothetical protein SERLADRAFT_405879 [Serpula lacrymans var. lacrymans S7.9]|uniref:Uncharacterized protein n=1 Tax=Serpula lacrymans var. lacrymans (strain S7.9) TaxID=578457 RepID=F8NJQ0_SERL9|nr:uncharacterized protein SERLADRAFT_405879 [Serpula lacrymans var. lacrymans S7.9]EGO28265.1 hypothetical protein SERLADRAFT_405879 [Serpula lacrymans var. lacrymans S7.9]
MVMYWPMVLVQGRDQYAEMLREEVFGGAENEGRAVDPSIISQEDETVEESVLFDPVTQTPERRETLDNSGSTSSSSFFHHSHQTNMFQKPPGTHHWQKKAQLCSHDSGFVKEGKEGSSILVLHIPTPCSQALKAISPPAHLPMPRDIKWSAPGPHSTSNQQGKGKGKGGGRDYEGCRGSAEKELGHPREHASWFTSAIDSIQNMDGIKAKPGKKGEEGRYDAVIVAHTDEAEATGLQGMKVGRLRVIFSLPDILYSYNIAPHPWPKGPLAYVEWYKISSQSLRQMVLHLVLLFYWGTYIKVVIWFLLLDLELFGHLLEG